MTPIDFEDTHLSRNTSPFIVTLETPMSKLHFLFTMLNINMLVVLKLGVIKGMITKLEFIKKRKTLNPKEEQELKKKRKEFKKAVLEEKAIELARTMIRKGKFYYA